MPKVTRKGYGVLLLLTKLLTVAGIAGVVIYLTVGFPVGSQGSLVQLLALVAPFVLAGMVCVVRKRWFTTSS